MFKNNSLSLNSDTFECKLVYTNLSSSETIKKVIKFAFSFYEQKDRYHQKKKKK